MLSILQLEGLWQASLSYSAVFTTQNQNGSQLPVAKHVQKQLNFSEQQTSCNGQIRLEYFAIQSIHAYLGFTLTLLSSETAIL